MCNCREPTTREQRPRRRPIARLERRAGWVDVFHLGDGLELVAYADDVAGPTAGLRLGLGEVLELGALVIPSGEVSR